MRPWDTIEGERDVKRLLDSCHVNSRSHSNVVGVSGKCHMTVSRGPIKADRPMIKTTFSCLSLINMSPKLPLRFYLEVGLMESYSIQIEANRHMRDALTAKDYSRWLL